MENNMFYIYIYIYIYIYMDETEIIQIVEILDEYVFSKVMLRKLDQLWRKLDLEKNRYESYSKQLHYRLYELNFVKRNVSTHFLEYIKVMNYLKYFQVIRQ